MKVKQNKGITLIALIITIIVLLILAVIAIRAVQGDGIIAYTQNAKRDYVKAQDEEKVQLHNYLDILNANNTNDAGGTGEILATKITAANYGDYIDYKVDLDGNTTNITDWKIFYNDRTNVYIIASNYLDNTKLPSGLKMSTVEGNPYSAYWESDSNFTAISSADITTEVASKYKISWQNENSSSTNNNARATADLLNTTAWTRTFGTGIEGAEAIGGPTLEMWVASWNGKNGMNATAYPKLYGNEYNEIGYYIGTQTGLSSVADNCDPIVGGYFVDLSSYEGYNDTLYFPGTMENCYAYMLASPSASSSNSMLGADSGWIGCGFNVGVNEECGVWPGVRPVVCLPANTIGIKDASGAWKISK